MALQKYLLVAHSFKKNLTDGTPPRPPFYEMATHAVK
jgi:hypothetical protein